jgi:tripartite-type tricarboxylate transporter receptor subunit TctC
MIPFLKSLLVLGLAFAATAHAQYPNRPVRMILSTSPGGGADVTARLLAPKLSEALGQNVIVENRPGASGMIAGEYVARQPADGYTILLDITTHAVNPALYSKMPYEPLKDLVPVTQIMQAPNVLVVHPSVPVASVKDFIAYVKSKPGGIAFASSGNGSAQHLAAEMFRMRTGIEMVHVPYKGGGPALADVVAGQVPAFFALLSSATPHIKSGRLKPIAVTGSQRAASMPELPSIAESGLPGYEIYDFNGLFFPARTPAEVIQRWQREVVRALSLPDVRQRFADLGTEVVGSTPQAFDAFLRAEITKWTQVVKEAGVKVD